MTLNSDKLATKELDLDRVKFNEMYSVVFVRTTVATSHK